MKKIITLGKSLGLSQTAKSLYWVFSGNFISTILTFFTLILVIANNVPKATNGIFIALFTLANLLSDLGEAGLGSALSVFVPRLLVEKQYKEAEEYVGTAFRLELIIGIVLLLGVSLLSAFLATYLFAKTQNINVLLTAQLTFLLLLFGFSTFVLSAYKKFREVSVVNIFYSLIRLGLLVVFLYTKQLTLLSILVSYIFAGGITWLYSLVFTRPTYLYKGWSLPKAHKMLRFSSFLAMQKIFISISSRLDILMMVPLAGAVAAGVYGVASRFALVYPLFIGSLGQVLAPNFGEFTSGKEGISYLRKVGLVIGILLVSDVIFYLSAPLLIGILVPKYPEAVPVLRTLLIAMVGFIVATPFVSFLIYTLKKPHITTFSSFVQLLVIFIANMYLIPRYKELGPAIGIGLGNLAICVIAIAATWYYLKKEL